jgi:hypothetical protein
LLLSGAMDPVLGGKPHGLSKPKEEDSIVLVSKYYLDPGKWKQRVDCEKFHS